MTSMASILPARTTGTATCSWSGSTCTTMRPLVRPRALCPPSLQPPGGCPFANALPLPQVASTCPVLCSWTWSRAPWTPCARDPSGRSSGQTTLFLVSRGYGVGWWSVSKDVSKVKGRPRSPVSEPQSRGPDLFYLDQKLGRWQDTLLPLGVTQSLSKAALGGRPSCPPQGKERGREGAAADVISLTAAEAHLSLGAGRGCPWEGLAYC